MTELEEMLFEKPEEEQTKTKIDDIAKAVDLIVSPENIDQKGRLTKQQIRGIIKVESLNIYLQTKLGKKVNRHTGKSYYIENRVLTTIADRIKVLPISLNGKGRDEIIKIVEGFGISIHEEGENGIKNRMFRR